ncbi:MAG: hypothetical protein OJF47_003848 [Nitrospira sp.]|nr:MAG: hypothetical protein OJF47_003848 [Nitrospira sp.]
MRLQEKAFGWSGQNQNYPTKRLITCHTRIIPLFPITSATKFLQSLPMFFLRIFNNIANLWPKPLLDLAINVH